MKVDLSCPIELWEYALPTAENPMLSFTFFNLSEHTISSIQITVTCFDADDQAISRHVERPMSLNAAGRQTFEVTLEVEDGVESVDLIIEKAWFEDGHDWRRQQDVRWVDYEPNELPPNRKQEQLRFVAGEDAVGFPSYQGSIWVCVCGRVNAADEAYCRRCGRSQDEVFERFTPEAVQAYIDERERYLEEKARMAREEASRQEFMRQDKARRKRRARRTRTAVITAGLVVLVLAYLFVVLGLPELKYQTGLSTLAAGRLTEAREAFVNLMDYRDAPDMVKECDLRLAKEYAAGGSMEKVDEALAMLAELGDYPGAQEAVTDAKYQKAQLLLDGSAYEEAGALFGSLADYKDAQSLRDQADYEIARALMAEGDYAKAAAAFKALGDYQDAAELAQECVYRPAMELMAAGDYYEASEMFASILDYQDAGEQRLESLRLDALRAQKEGEFHYAAERFAMLGSYKDAPEQYKHTVYLNANAYRDAGQYDLAVKLYATIPEYEDAADQVKACTYLPAKAYMTDGQYETAAAMFVTVPGYLDADELYNQCVYLPATAALKEEDYDQAIELFALIPEYSDVKRLMPQAQYKRAEKLEADGDLEGAIAAFGSLADYSDALTREKAARYAWAEAAFDAGDFETASERFAELGRYQDSQTRVKECAYGIAMRAFDAEDYETAYHALLAIDAYDIARNKAREAAYQWGVQLNAKGDLEGAAEAFGLAGRFQDAEDRRKECIYRMAQNLMDEGDYQEAGALFDTVRDYSDARAKRDENYDLWLSEKYDQATALYEDGSYQELINLLSGMDYDTLPKSYANIKTMFQDSNYKMARQLINEDRALEAYGYLMAADGYKSSNELLDKNIYRILGTWETPEGIRYAFFLNGTANLAGERGYFNMFNPYGISFGSTQDKESMVRVLSYSSGSSDGLRLREDASGKTIVLTRVKPPEVSETNDSGGSMVLTPQQQEHLDDVMIDVVEGGGEIDLDAPDTDTGDELPEENQEEG